MNFPIDLIGELVAVRPEEIKSTIRLPDWKRSLSGVVLARGPNVQAVGEGDRISFGAAVGMDSVLNGQEIRILKEQDIDFVYEYDWAPKCMTCEKYVESGEIYCTDCLDEQA